MVKHARLLHAPPEMVFDALAEVGVKESIFFGFGDEIESALLERNDPQINLALAAYGYNADVLVKLYRSALSLADSEKPSAYDDSLRRACLSNRKSIWRVGYGHASVFGDTKYGAPLLCKGDLDDAQALISNPTVGDQVLQDLYMHRGPFADLSDSPGGRWFYLICASRLNPRITLDTSNDSGPDLSSWRIQEAIEHLIASAPANKEWADALMNLAHTLDHHVSPHGDAITADVYSKWLTVKDPSENYAPMTVGQELCCTIAARYGTEGINDSESSTLDEGWRARLCRCKQYAWDRMTPDDMDAAYEKDGNAFVIGVLWNDSVLSSPALREHFESTCLRNLDDNDSRFYSHARWRYEERCEQIEQKARDAAARWSDDDEETADSGGRQPESGDAAERELIAAVEELSRTLDAKLHSFELWVSIGLAIIIVLLLAILGHFAST